MVSVEKLADTLLVMADERSDTSEAVDLFFSYLNDRGLVYLAPKICAVLEDREEKQKTDDAVKITTAREIPDDLSKKLRSMVHESGDYSEVNMETDSSLLGGFRIRAGNMLYDGSIRHNLENLKRTLGV